VTSVRERGAGITLSTPATRTRIEVTKSPATGAIRGIPVASSGTVPKEVGLDRKTLTTLGFQGNAGQVLVLTKEQLAVAVGIGEPGTADAARLRDAAAAFARAVPRYSSLSTDLADTPGVPSEAAAQAVTEGILWRGTHTTSSSRSLRLPP